MAISIVNVDVWEDCKVSLSVNLNNLQPSLPIGNPDRASDTVKAVHSLVQLDCNLSVSILLIK